MVRATHVVPIAPATIWPSTPMFHSPAWNVTISPAAASTSGIHVINVSDDFAAEPNEPSHSRRSASHGGASTTSRAARHAKATATLHDATATVRVDVRCDPGRAGARCHRSLASLADRTPAADELAELVGVGGLALDDGEDAAGEEHGDAVAVAQQLVEVGGGEDDGRAVVAPFQQLVPHPRRRLDVEPACRVLHQQQAQPRRQHRQQQALLVAARQRLGGRSRASL